ncbi:MAG: multidrug efflux SMR transporter [Rhodomicrobium sp.]|nr:multidrug efflux SMR transporter [Rhodomicrobium sp.]
MAWIYLIVAGILEIGFTTALRYTEGFTRIVPNIVFILFIFASFYFLEKALKTIPLGTAYAVWTGIGAAGTAIVGVLAYNEPASAARLFFITTLIGSIIGLKLVSH